MLVPASAGTAAAMGVLAAGAQVMGGPAPLAGPVPGRQGLVADVMLRGTESRDVHQDAAGRAMLGSPVVMGRPVRLGRLVVTNSPVVMGRPVQLGRLVVTGSPVVRGRPAVRGRSVVTGNLVVMGAGRGSGALGAAQAEAGLQTDPPETGQPGRAEARTTTEPGRTVAPQGDAGRDLRHSGGKMVAG